MYLWWETIQTRDSEKHRGRGNTHKRSLLWTWEGNRPETAQMCPNGVLVPLILQEEPKTIDTEYSGEYRRERKSKFRASAGHRCPSHHPTYNMSERMTEFTNGLMGKFNMGREANVNLNVDFRFIHSKTVVVFTIEVFLVGMFYMSCLLWMFMSAIDY